MSDIPQPGGIPQGGAEVLQQSYSTADLMSAYAEHANAHATPQPPDPTAFLRSDSGLTYRQAHLQRKQALANGVVTNALPGTVGKVLDAKDELGAVSHLSVTDPLSHGAAAGVMALHSNNLPDGFAGAQADYARVEAAHGAGVLKSKRLEQLWRQFQERPTSLNSDQAAELNTLAGSLAQATDPIQDAELKLGNGRVSAIEMAPAGPIIHVDYDPSKALDAKLVASLAAPDTTLPVLEHSSRFGAYLTPDGTVGVQAEPNPSNAVKFRHLYPCLVQDGVARWLPGAPRQVADTEALARQLNDSNVGHVTETFDVSALTGFGGHPAVVPGIHIAVDVADGVPSGRFAHFGTVTDLGSIVRSEPAGPPDKAAWDYDPSEEPDPSARTTTRTRRLLITTHETDAVQFANEILDTGAGSNVTIYAHGDVPGFTKVREHLYSDGVTVHAFRNLDADVSASNGFPVWVKDAGTLPKGNDTPVTFTQQADGMITTGTARIVPTGKGTFETHGNILRSTQGGAALVGFGVFPGRIPDVVLAFDADTAAHLQGAADVFAHRDGNGIRVDTAAGLLAAARAVDTLRALGVVPSRVLTSQGTLHASG